MSEKDAQKNSLGRQSVVSYTSSAAVQWMSLLTTVKMPSTTIDSESVQVVGSGCTLREA